MKKLNYLLLSVLIGGLLFNACKDDKDDDPEPTSVGSVPEFYLPGNTGQTQPDLQQILSSADGVALVRDLDFNPTRSGELWVLNQGTNSTGGNTLTVTNAGQADQSVDVRRDGNAWHFMAMATSIAFGDNGDWATAQGIQDANRHPSGLGIFTGPTLWSGDMSIYAEVGTPPMPGGPNGSHLDMVHQSPYGMGIAHERDNVYWVFDGWNGNICRYDFADPHVPGGDDHSDARVRRYNEVGVTMKSGIPSHMILDSDKKWLYIVDNGANRVLRMDITTGNVRNGTPIIPRANGEPLAEYSEMENVTWEVFLSGGFQELSGIEIKDNRLFLSDHATGEIIAYDINTRQEMARIATGTPGIMGLTISPVDGKLWYVNATERNVVRVEPQ